MRLLVCFLALTGLSQVNSFADTIPLYVGTGGDGIYLTQFDSVSGSLSKPVQVATTSRPTFLWIHRPTRSLYSVCEVGRSQEGKSGAAIVSWAIADDGSLKKRNQQSAGGDGPCFVAASADGKYAAIANYGSGSVSLFPLKADGSIRPASATAQHAGSSVNKRRQSAPHAHSSRFDPSGQRVLAADLGTDNVYIYDIADGKLNTSQPPAISMPPGSGPRHFTFSQDSKYMLVLGELTGTITSVRYDMPQVTTVETISTMADDFPADSPRGSAEILFHPNGKWVYATNRGPSEIAVFDYDSDSGKLKRTSAIPSGGQHPRNFRISPDGRFLLCANQNTNNIVVFAINQTSGALTATQTELTVEKPMCLKFLLPQ